MMRNYLVALLFFFTAVARGRDEFTPGESGTFHPHHRDKYMDIINDVKDWVNDSRDVDFPYSRLPDHPVLQPQQLKDRPPLWFVMLLYSWMVVDRTQLAIRSDNLYLSGFANAAGEWFSFKPDDRDKYVIPDSTMLDFRTNYASLTGTDEDDDVKPSGQAWKKLIGLELGKDSILDALTVLARCDREKTAERTLKLAVAKIIVAFIEGLRFPYIRELVRDAWSNPNGGRLDEKGAKLIVYWKELSCALLVWDGSADKDSWHTIKEAKLLRTHLGITTPEEALGYVWPILQGGKDCSH